MPRFAAAILSFSLLQPLAAGETAHVATQPAVSTPLPAEHWVYAALTRLETAGIRLHLELPPKALHPREKLAETVQSLLWEVSRVSSGGAPGRPVKEYADHARA